MIIAKPNALVSTITTNNFESVLLVNRKNLHFSIVAIQNIDTVNGLQFRIYGSLDDSRSLPSPDPDTSNIWVKLKDSTQLSAKSDVIETLTEPWRWLLIQVKSDVADHPAAVNVSHGGV